MSNISLKEYLKRKDALEKTLAQFISEKKSEFEKETSTKIKDIQVTMADVSSLDEKDRYIISGVEIGAVDFKAIP